MSQSYPRGTALLAFLTDVNLDGYLPHLSSSCRSLKIGGEPSRAVDLQAVRDMPVTELMRLGMPTLAAKTCSNKAKSWQAGPTAMAEAAEEIQSWSPPAKPTCYMYPAYDKPNWASRAARWDYACKSVQRRNPEANMLSLEQLRLRAHELPTFGPGGQVLTTPRMWLRQKVGCLPPQGKMVRHWSKKLIRGGNEVPNLEVEPELSPPKEAKLYWSITDNPDCAAIPST